MVLMNPIFLLQTVPEGRMFALDAQTFTQAGVNLIIVGILRFNTVFVAV